MAKVIAAINQKGGVGKSTTAATLAAGLTLKGFKVLSIDLDAQGNLTFTGGCNADSGTSLDWITGEATAEAVTVHTAIGDIIPADNSLSGADKYITDTGKEYKLKEALDAIKGKYDYVVIDTPPALSVLTVNALTACDSVIIPAQPDLFSLQGIGELYGTIQTVRKYCNKELKIDGILLTRYNARSVFTKEMTEQAKRLAQQCGTKVFNATIRDTITVKEAQLLRQSLFQYAPKAKVTEDYTAFINELLGE